MSVTTQIFVSHKHNDAALALQLTSLLKSNMQNVIFFMSEDIPKGDEWRAEVERKLQDADHLILLYTDPNEDWSWCVYETTIFNELICQDRGEYARRNRSELSTQEDGGQHKVYCIHFPEINPPGPFQKLQAIAAKSDDIAEWLEGFWTNTTQTRPFQNIQSTADRLTELLNKARPTKSVVNYLSPWVWVAPEWPMGAEGTANWNDTASIPPNLFLARSQVKFTAASPLDRLGISFVPDTMTLIEFLNQIDADDTDDSPWVDRLLDSIHAVLKGLEDPNITFFRCRKGGVFRPIIDSVTRSDDGRDCEIRLVFVDSFSSPLASSPSPLERLASALRIAVRTRIEVLDKYEGKMAQEGSRLAQSSAAALDELGRRLSLGDRLIETFETILLESKMEGHNWDDDASIVFEDKQQSKYEELHDKFRDTYTRLKQVAREEGKQDESKYLNTEVMLATIKQINDDYFKITIPRVSIMLGVSQQVA